MVEDLCTLGKSVVYPITNGEMSSLSHEEQLKLIQDLEIEMMADMYNRMSNACQAKCVPPKYKDAELAKGEAVCIDRCVAKYLDVHDRIGKKLTAMSTQDEETMKKLQGQMQGAPK